MEYAIIIDGASRGNGVAGGLGVIIKDLKNEKTLKKISKPLGEASNNIAEYSALEEALNQIEELNLDNVVILSDSNLIVSQIQGTFRIKNANLKTFAMTLKKRFKELSTEKNIKIDYVPREYTFEADALARQASVESSEQETETKYPFLKKEIL